MFLLAAALLVLAAPGASAAAQGAAAPVDSVSAPIANVRYDVTFDRAAAARRTLRVVMTFDAAGDAPVLLSLPAWTPGAYEITNFAKWVSNFAATTAGGSGAPAALAWDKIDYDTWRVRPAGARRIAVSFDFVADSLDNAMAWARPEFALFNGTNVFLFTEGRGFDAAASVVVHTEPGWLVATGMQPGEGAGHFTAANYHDLVDTPFFIGRFDYDSAQVAGKWTRLATYPAGSVSGARRAKAWDWIKRVIPPG